MIHCGTLWYIVVHCGTLWYIVGTLWVHCGTLWYIVVHCGTLWGLVGPEADSKIRNINIIKYYGFLRENKNAPTNIKLKVT